MQILTTIHIISAIFLIISVLLQNRGSGVSGVFGGDSESYYTRRGLDKNLFIFTIILAIIFIGSIVARLIIQD